MSKAAQPATKVVLENVRFSYAHVFAPAAIVEGNDPKYSVTILIPKKDKKALAKIEKAIEAAKQNGATLWGGKIPATLKTPLRDGDEDKPDQEEFEGMYFMNANSLNKPGLVDKKGQPIIDPTEFYSGCYGAVSVNFFPYNQAGNRGVGAGLNNIMKTDDGEPLAGRSRPEDDFRDLIGDDDEDDLGL